MAGNNNQNANQNQANPKVKITVEEKQAVQSIRELERQFTKLSQLSKRGMNTQDGFLSKKQVQLYKSILNEMQQAHDQWAKKLDSTNQEVARRQQQYNQSQARGASQTHVAFYQNKLQQAQSRQQFLQNVVSQQRTTMNNTMNGPSNTIGNMHQLNNGGMHLLHGGMHILSRAGMVTSVHSLGNYVQGGIGLARAQEHNAWQQAQKLGNYGGDFRDKVWDAQSVGRDQYGQNFGLGYDTNQTLRTQLHLMYGGTDGNRQKLADDTLASQQFSRAYGMAGTHSIVASNNALRTMGAVDEGDQKNFAKLLAGEIEKAGMHGREEEAMRATTNLVQQIGNKMASVTPQTLQNTMAMQAMLGQAVPALKGDRGAQVLGSMDNAIKNGGSGMDILLGKGIDPKYMSLKGMNDLAYKKEEGLTPENLSTVLTNARKLTNGNQDVLESILTDPQNGIGLTHHQLRSIKQSGLLDRWTRGETISADELKKTGALAVDKGDADYRNSAQFKEEQAKAQMDKTKSDMGLPALRATQEGKSLWSSLPEWMQMTGIGGAGIGAGFLTAGGRNSLAARGVRSLWRTLAPNINGNGGIRNWFRGGGGPPSNIISGAGNTLRGVGGSLLKGAGKLLGPIGTYMTLRGTSSLADDSYDYIFGHSKGSMKFNTGGATGTYTDDRAPIWKRLFNDGTPVSKDLSMSKTRDTSNFSAVTSNSSSNSSKQNTSHTVNVVISGRVDGMNDSNQDTVASGIGNFFKDVFNNPQGFNLSLDMKRTIG